MATLTLIESKLQTNVSEDKKSEKNLKISEKKSKSNRAYNPGTDRIIKLYLFSLSTARA